KRRATMSRQEAQMTDRIRVGIVGATVTQGGSGWGANAHVPALKALPGYELKAVCTSREDTAKASAAAFGVDHAFHRFGDMAAHPDVDLLVVCVRVPGHRELVMAGLQAGKPVCCEWPLGKNLAEAEEMAALARQRSLKTIVGLQALSLGPNQMHAGKGKEPLAAMPLPDRYRFAPSGTPAGQPYNVAQAYARAADALRGGGSFDVDFDLAVQRHKLIDAIERSSATGRSVKVGP